MLGFGVIGYLMRKFEFPTVPLIISLILGDKLENALRQSLTLSDGSLMIFISRPITLIFILLAITATSLSLYSRFKGKNLSLFQSE